MQKKMYLGGLPWELDRVGILNYFKAVMEGAGIVVSYVPPFVNPTNENENAVVKLVDVFVSLDHATQKSRGFGFITLEFMDESGTELFEKIVGLLQGKTLIGIRGDRELIANEAAPREENGGSRENRYDRNDRGGDRDNRDSRDSLAA